jgi:hypothetical protein
LTIQCLSFPLIPLCNLRSHNGTLQMQDQAIIYVSANKKPRR